MEIAIDTETTGLWRYKGDRPFMVSFCDADFEGHVFEWRVDPYTRYVDVDYQSEEYAYYKEVMEDDKIPKVFANAQFDILMSDSVGIGIAGEVYDVQDMARILCTNRYAYGLKQLASTDLGISKNDEKELKDFIKMFRRLAKGKYCLGDKVVQDYWLTQYSFELIKPTTNTEFALAAKGRNACKKYCQFDTIKTMALFQKYRKLIDDSDVYTRTYKKEQTLFPILLDIAKDGILTDINESIRCREDALAHKQYYLEELQKLTNNPSFTATDTQIRDHLYGVVGLPVTVKTEKGTPSVGYAVLYSNKDEETGFCKNVLAFKKYSKGYSTFFKKYPRIVDENNIIHVTFNGLGARRTGRLSSSGAINLQQISSPKSSQKGNNVVDAKTPFIPGKGYSFWLFDYSGQEMCIYAALADIKFIKDAIYSKKDINDEITNKVYGDTGNKATLRNAIRALELDNVDCDSELVLAQWEQLHWNRSKAKAFKQDAAIEITNEWLCQFDWKIASAEKSLGKKTTRTNLKINVFTLLYGGSVNTLIPRIGEKDAYEFVDMLEAAFPEMAEYKRKMTRYARRHGHILTAFGRKIDIHSDEAYKAVNYSIQSVAADMMKTAMIRVAPYLKETELDAKIKATVHDELMLRVLDAHAYKWLINGVRVLMEDFESLLGVPMSVGINRCRENWSIEEDIYTNSLVRLRM